MLKKRVVYVWEDESFKISYIKSIILIIQQCQKSPHIQREGLEIQNEPGKTKEYAQFDFIII